MKRFIILLIIPFLSFGQQPYWGTIFIEPDIITNNDPSSFLSASYIGEDMVLMYDRRVANWVNVNAFLFKVIWDDGLTSIAQINEEFRSVEQATIEAEKYGFLIGQLPTFLRADVEQIWIHKGVELFGGGNSSILIHTGQSTIYEKDGIIEETLVHEAAHTSIDAYHASSYGWLNAQNLDNQFISDYAYQSPNTEDIAESFLVWLAVRYKMDRISDDNFQIITESIPNRLIYFDNINCEMYPVTENSSY